DDVPAHALGIALEGVPETAAAARAQLDDGPRLEQVGIRLQHVPLIGPAGVDHDIGPDGVAAAEETPRRGDRALEPEVQVGLGLDLEDAVQATAAPELPRPAGIRAKPVAADHRRVLHLEDLDRVVLEAAVHVVDQPVLAVGALEPAPAASVRHHVEKRLAVPSGVATGE